MGHNMPLFDLAPKDTPNTLFGREEEMAELIRLIDARRWVAVLGPRMVGKTSLVKVAQARMSRPGAYVNLWGVKSVQGLLENLVHGINESRSLVSKIKGAIHHVEGITVGPAGLSVAKATQPVGMTWELFDLIGRESKDCLFVLDEIQELGPSSGALLKLLGRLFNTHPNLVFVFTGSKFGLMRSLLEPGGSSPLYGRSPVTFSLEPFDRTRAEEFLRRGAKQYNLTLSNFDLDTIVGGPLDGTPGWLTLLGNNLAIRRLSLDKALSETIREGKHVAGDEIRHFLQGQGRDPDLYWPALKAAALGSGWSAIRSAMEISTGRHINTATVHRVVLGLQAEHLVFQDSKVYRLQDPMVRAFVSDAPKMPVE